MVSRNHTTYYAPTTPFAKLPTQKGVKKVARQHHSQDHKSYGKKKDKFWCLTLYTFLSWSRHDVSSWLCVDVEFQLRLDDHFSTPVHCAEPITRV